MMQNEFKDYALYTISERAIPNLIDGLKPVQRMVLYSCLINTSKDFRKVSALAGIISDYGYNHAETSAAGALSLMAADWNSSVNLVEGRGNFGTRLNPSCGAARYIYARVHQDFYKYFGKDLDLCPVHEDPEHVPPKYYLPVIPLVVCGSISGIATGFKTKILPRKIEDVITCCKEYINTKKITTVPRIYYPNFKGDISSVNDSWRILGKITRKSKTKIKIEELPWGFYTVESYKTYLDKCEEKRLIVSYSENCTDKIDFDIVLKNNNTYSDDDLYNILGLKKHVMENLNVIDENNTLVEYTNVQDIIRDFCKHRLIVLSKRIQKELSSEKQILEWLLVKRKFIEAIITNKLVFTHQKTRSMIIKEIESCGISSNKEHTLRCLDMNFLSLTKEEINKCDKKISETNKKISYWKNTTQEKEFIKDLDDLDKV